MKYLFWAGAAIVVYTYFGYPAWLWLRSQWRKRPIRRAPCWPRVSVVMVVRNEESVLERKLKNFRAFDYPADRIEFIVVSDGSTDRTVEILNQQAQRDKAFRVLVSSQPQGKAAGLNDAVASAEGEVLFFTDARQQIEPEALKLLSENFADPEVGCASGQLMLGDPGLGESRQGTGLYWTVEKKVREWESASGSVVGVTGAIYAARRDCWVPIPAGTILDDVYFPMQVVRQGSRVVFDDRARAWDIADLGKRQEFNRKVRTLTGNYQLVQLAPWLLKRENPLRFEFVSHKLTRLLAPFALVAIFLSSLLLPGSWSRLALLLQVIFYLLSLVGILGLAKTGLWARLADVARTFVILNSAAAVAFLNCIAGRKTVWVRAEPEPRVSLKASETP